MSLSSSKMPEELERIKVERTVQKLGALFLSTTLVSKLSRGVFEEYLTSSFHLFLQDERLELTMVWEKLCTVPGVHEDEIFRFFMLLLDQTFLWKPVMPEVFLLLLSQKSQVQGQSDIQRKSLEGWSTAEVRHVGSKRDFEQRPLSKSGPASQRSRAETPAVIDVVSITGNHETIKRLRQKRDGQGVTPLPLARGAFVQGETSGDSGAPEASTSPNPSPQARSSAPTYNKTKLPPRRKAPARQEGAKAPEAAPAPKQTEKSIDVVKAALATPEAKPQSSAYMWERSDPSKRKALKKKLSEQAKPEKPEKASQKQWIMLAVLGVVLVIVLLLNI